MAKDPAEIEDIMLDLCSLLNGGGGVLLFDCEQQYLEVRPVGESYFEVDKDKYRSLMK